MAKKQDIDDFTVPARVYSDYELQDFHNKIQKFWDEPRLVEATKLSSTGQIEANKGLPVVDRVAQKFRHQDLHVAYGAARKVPHGKTFVYQYNSERYELFNNLWGQYEDYRRKQDWIENKNLEGLEQTAEQIPFF